MAFFGLAKEVARWLGPDMLRQLDAIVVAVLDGTALPDRYAVEDSSNDLIPRNWLREVDVMWRPA